MLFKLRKEHLVTFNEPKIILSKNRDKLEGRNNLIKRNVKIKSNKVEIIVWMGDTPFAEYEQLASFQ